MTQQYHKANLFHLTKDDIHITYSTTSLRGQPEFTYRDAEQRYAFRGNEIRTQKGELGTLLSVSLKTAADASVTVLTLVLPDIQLAGHQPASFRTPSSWTPSSFQTFAIVTQCLGTLPGEGPRQTYEVLDLQGTAQSVHF